MRFRISIVVLALVIAVSYEHVMSQSNSSYNGFDLVDKTGNIRKPSDYRDRYQALGTYMVLDPMGDQMHVVYASPGTAEYYRKNRKFADGTVLVKEIFETDHAKMTTGTHIGPRERRSGSFYQGRKRTLSRQSAVGQWVGMGSLQV